MGSRELVSTEETRRRTFCSMCNSKSILALLLVVTTNSLPGYRYINTYESGKNAVVKLVPGGDSGVTGQLALSQQGPYVVIKGKIFGLTPGKHGFHIHMNGSLDNNCKAAGGHFNPDMAPHSFPQSPERHAGDLGNIYAPEPYTLVTLPTYVNIADSVITLGDGGPRDVAGRAVVVRAGEDDLGLGVGDKAEGSKKTGNAGARVACGIIELVEYN